tara:strand:+ start:31 stop:276 length:246 start_codon:yes stop_codon:yes gene_type:complete
VQLANLQLTATIHKYMWLGLVIVEWFKLMLGAVGDSFFLLLILQVKVQVLLPVVAVVTFKVMFLCNQVNYIKFLLQAAMVE